MIFVNNVSKTYTKNFFILGKKISTIALSNIRFSLKKPEIVGVFGKNGSGKSTLIKLLSGIIKPTNGSVSVLNQNPFLKEESFLKKIALYLGNTNIIDDDLTAHYYFSLQRYIYEIDKDLFEKNLRNIIKDLKIKSLLNIEMKKLSFGQRSLIEIASVFVSLPKVVLLDEFLTGLDLKNIKLLLTFIKKYQKENKAFIIFTSNKPLIFKNFANKSIYL